MALQLLAAVTAARRVGGSSLMTRLGSPSGGGLAAAAAVQSRPQHQHQQQRCEDTVAAAAAWQRGCGGQGRGGVGSLIGERRATVAVTQARCFCAAAAEPRGSTGGDGPHASKQMEGIENQDQGPGDYSMPQIRPEVYTAGGGSREARERRVADASDEAKRAGGRTLEGREGEEGGVRVEDTADTGSGSGGGVGKAPELRPDGVPLPLGHDVKR